MKILTIQIPDEVADGLVAEATHSYVPFEQTQVCAALFLFFRRR
jgi:hypothetical protein